MRYNQGINISSGVKGIKVESPKGPGRKAGRFCGECPGRGHRATDKVKARAYHGDSMKGKEQSQSAIYSSLV